MMQWNLDLWDRQVLCPDYNPNQAGQAPCYEFFQVDDRQESVLCNPDQRQGMTVKAFATLFTFYRTGQPFYTKEGGYLPRDFYPTVDNEGGYAASDTYKNSFCSKSAKMHAIGDLTMGYISQEVGEDARDAMQMLRIAYGMTDAVFDAMQLRTLLSDPVMWNANAGGTGGTQQQCAAKQEFYSQVLASWSCNLNVPTQRATACHDRSLTVDWAKGRVGKTYRIVSNAFPRRKVNNGVQDHPVLVTAHYYMQSRMCPAWGTWRPFQSTVPR